MTKDTAPKDLIDEIVNDWQKFDATLDVSGTEIIGRIVRLSSLIGRKVDENLAQYGLMIGEFDVLAALLRADKHRLTPGQLQTLMLISSGGLSNRIKRLEKLSYIVRSQDHRDRRGVNVQLTKKGKALIEEAVRTHLTIENELVASLSSQDAEQLQHLLQKLLISVDE